MQYYGKAKQAATAIIEAFRDPASLPGKLAQAFYRGIPKPSDSWTWRNRVLAILQCGEVDCRTFQEWKRLGRFPKRGSKAIYILSPVTYCVTDEETGEKKTVLRGFQGSPRFPYSRTTGEPLDTPDTAELASTPLLSIAESMGINVSTEAANGQYLGAYSPGNELVKLSSKNLSTFAHELVHAAEKKLGKLTKAGQDPAQETVAELGGAVLLTLMGYESDADLGGCYEYVKRYNGDAVNACSSVLKRVCDAVGYILETAETA